MISTSPKFRRDLTVSQQQNAKGKFFVVKDPLCGEFFRFGEAEEFILRQLDGETPLEAVRKNTEVELGATIPTETLDAFIKNLEKTLLQQRNGKKERLAAEASQRQPVVPAVQLRSDGYCRGLVRGGFLRHTLWWFLGFLLCWHQESRLRIGTYSDRTSRLPLCGGSIGPGDYVSCFRA
jgi:hypothetical protein